MARTLWMTSCQNKPGIVVRRQWQKQKCMAKDTDALYCLHIRWCLLEGESTLRTRFHWSCKWADLNMFFNVIYRVARSVTVRMDKMGLLFGNNTCVSTTVRKRLLCFACESTCDVTWYQLTGICTSRDDLYDLRNVIHTLSVGSDCVGWWFWATCFKTMETRVCAHGVEWWMEELEAWCVAVNSNPYTSAVKILPAAWFVLISYVVVSLQFPSLR